MILNNNEKIEDLQDKRLKIIQAKDSYRFSVDSILLLNFIRLKNYENIIDLGTGSGIIPLLLFGKKKGLSIYGVEIQKDLADMARRSVELNKLQNGITIIQEDFRNLKNNFKNQQFDVVVSNPPYISMGQGKINPSSSRAIARHEIKGDLEDIISVSNYLLKNKIKIIPVPGVSALITALVVSGLPTDKFVFEGFLPRKIKERKRYFKSIENEERTIIFYETPHRLKKALKDMLEILGDRKVVIARELTKLYEEIIRGKLSQVLTEISTKEVKGEITLIVQGGIKKKENSSTDFLIKECIIEEYLKKLKNQGYSNKEIIKITQEKLNIQKIIGNEN